MVFFVMLEELILKEFWFDEQLCPLEPGIIDLSTIDGDAAY